MDLTEEFSEVPNGHQNRTLLLSSTALHFQEKVIPMSIRNIHNTR